MSAHSLHLPRPAAWPLRIDFKTSLIGWGGFMVLLSCYCMTYEAVIANKTVSFGNTFVYMFKNWGVWFVTTPIFFATLRKYSTAWHDRAVEFVALVAVLVSLSAAVPVAIDLLTHARDASTSLMIFLPRYVAVMGVVYLVWHVFLRERRAESPAATVDDSSLPAAEQAPAPPATLLVSKGADQCLIQIGRIECVSAAGNYVEIVERGQRYLMRATLKQVEDLLPAADFIRIHRCHLVRRDEIERIKSQPSGNGTVQLRSGQQLPMSKKHKQALQRYRPAE